jgi:DNA-binding winged helix-turn-helix (wHTH) protein
MPKCPRCHQPIRHERCGIYLPPRKARIIDVLAIAGDAGVGMNDLIYAVWDDYDARSPQTVKSHISQLNDFLTETDYWIRAERGGRQPATYFLMRKKEKVAIA